VENLDFVVLKKWMFEEDVPPNGILGFWHLLTEFDAFPDDSQISIL